MSDGILDPKAHLFFATLVAIVNLEEGVLQKVDRRRTQVAVSVEALGNKIDEWR